MQQANGVMFWALDHDAQGELSLVNAIYQTVHIQSLISILLKLPVDFSLLFPKHLSKIWRFYDRFHPRR